MQGFKENSSTRSRLCEVLSYLPQRLQNEIGELSVGIRNFCNRINEVRVRADAASSIIVGGSLYPLIGIMSRAEVALILERLSGDALYAQRENIENGYIISPGGIRVGVAGRAKYDAGRLVGVGEINSLVFRISESECDYGDELYSAWLSAGCRNMLIASPPLGGKTTAIRSLAGRIGGGKFAKRVVVVDERCEFDAAAYSGACVDILRGYKRMRGLEVALRTMSPEVVVVDEIATSDEADAAMSLSGAGVALVATAHAKDADDLYRRPCLSALMEAGVFFSLALIRKTGERYGFDFHILGGKS